MVVSNSNHENLEENRQFALTIPDFMVYCIHVTGTTTQSQKKNNFFLNFRLTNAKFSVYYLYERRVVNGNNSLYDLNRILFLTA